MKCVVVCLLLLSTSAFAKNVEMECAELFDEEQDSLSGYSDEAFGEHHPVRVQFTNVAYEDGKSCPKEAREGGLQFYGADRGNFCGFDADAGNNERITWICRNPKKDSDG